jgi:hypothetical protein
VEAQEPEEQVEANNDVGMSLMAGEEADAVVRILRDELGDRLRIRDCITYLKLETDAGQLEVRFDDVAELLGHSFSLADFQTIFASYYGRPFVDDDRISIHANMTAGVYEEDLA